MLFHSFMKRYQTVLMMNGNAMYALRNYILVLHVCLTTFYRRSCDHRIGFNINLYKIIIIDSIFYE
jgi:hypothetical protein